MNYSNVNVILHFNFLFDGYGDFQWYFAYCDILKSYGFDENKIKLLATFNNYSQLKELDKIKKKFNFFLTNFSSSNYKFKIFLEEIINKFINIQIIIDFFTPLQIF
jgi:5,10-methylenetetrahydrofolate reductase